MMPVFGGKGMTAGAIAGGGDPLVTVGTLSLVEIAGRVVIFGDVGAMAFGAVARRHGGSRGRRGGGRRRGGGGSRGGTARPAPPSKSQFRYADQNQQTQKKPHPG